MDELDKKLNVNQDEGSRMRYLDWRIISTFVYVFGVVIFLVGLYVYLYYETNFIGQLGLAFYPYRNYAIPLIIVGIALLIMGVIMDQKDRKKTKSGKNNNR